MYENDGKLRMISDREHELLKQSNQSHPIFCVGQIIKINEAYFRIKSIRPKEMRLRAIPNPTLAKKPGA